MAANTPERIGSFAALQSVAELSLGSLVHALNLPLGGHLLSLNQGVVLTLAARPARARGEAVSCAAGVGNVAAVLKSLSPAGKRLTPMLAISMQGVLFSLGLALGGINFLGVALGSVALSLWGFAQPLLVGYALFGAALFSGIEKLWREAAQALGIPESYGLRVLIGLVALKALAAVALSLSAWYGGERFEARYAAQIESLRKRAPLKVRDESKAGSPGAGALRDLANPWFLVSLVLSVAFLGLSGAAGAPALAWYALRTLAIAWLFFWALRAIPAQAAQRLLSRFPRLQSALAQALKARGEASR